MPGQTDNRNCSVTDRLGQHTVFVFKMRVAHSACHEGNVDVSFTEFENSQVTKVHLVYYWKDTVIVPRWTEQRICCLVSEPNMKK